MVKVLCIKKNNVGLFNHLIYFICCKSNYTVIK